MKVRWAQPALRHQLHEEEIGLLDRLLIKPQRDRLDFNRRMFDEDFARVFHHTNRRTGELFELETNDQELSDRLLGNVKTRYGPHPVDETIYELVEEIAQSLVWFRDAYYFLHDDAEKGETHIVSFATDRVFKCLGLYFQYLPKRTQSHWDKEDEALPREIRFLDKTKLIHFRLPKFIRKILTAQNKILTTLDKHHGASTGFFPHATHDNPNPVNHFDFRVWNETVDRALYRATRRTGWNGRKHDSSKRSDFFDCYRLIKFRRNQITLRDQILVQLGDELSRVGRRYSPDFRISISATGALPSIGELDELDAKLTREEVGFSEIIDFCFKR
ncbi:hypothetical protein KUD11_02435 [Roseovarius sp. LXJ103]|uniref:hypothetical protein n=1 Tax=Roseovarius carneus TaxID=2853164 RepID=UPI000D6173DD|nr:hypothetical protein [Roseovarius carneus]MBZ8117498.1 hypothetical protein [Roseovarius carneus]PWE36704.1 hypothetical protein DD563_12505 [Pelagicola sp. LXJ1103]